MCGPRTIHSYELVVWAIAAGERAGFVITELVSGHAAGVDQLAERWAEEQGIPITRFLLDWERWRGGAPRVRNREMFSYAEAALVVWNARTTGTLHMVIDALAARRPVFVVIPPLKVCGGRRCGYETSLLPPGTCPLCRSRPAVMRSAGICQTCYRAARRGARVRKCDDAQQHASGYAAL